LAALALAAAAGPAAAAPANVRAPALGYVVESLQPGADIVASPGVWRSPEGVPLYYIFRWESCRETACTPIPGANSSTYRIGLGDVGSRLRVVVTAWGTAGQASAFSGVTQIVAAGARVPKLRVIPRKLAYGVRAGRTLAISGRVNVGPVAAGKLVQLQWLDGRRWRPASQSRINDRGFFVLRYPFSQRGGYVLKMRVLVPKDSSWPNRAVASRPITVRVAPAAV
jgi:hypothetical protein